MKVRVITPTKVVLDADAVHVTVEDITGSLGIRPGHIPMIAALEVSMLVARDAHGEEKYVALDGGVLTVSKDTVTVTSQRAVIGDDLEHLDNTVLADFRSEAEQDRTANAAFQKLRVAFLKRLFDLETARPLI